MADTLAGTFAGLIAVLVVGTMFITAEFRRGLIRVTLTASPQRNRVLAAKAIVTGSVAFAVGLPAAYIALLTGERKQHAGGISTYPVPALTEVRMIVGTAALLGVAAVLALGIGAVLRRGAPAVAAVIAVIVLPYFFAGPLAVLPAGAADWLLRVTPAAGFAIQQGYPRYPQLDASYTPANGYFPLAPWAGFAVLALWAALALALAGYCAAQEGRMIQATPAQRAQLAKTARARRTSMRDALHAEWTKARTLPGTGWLLLAAVALTVIVSAAVAATVRCPSGHCAEDPAKISLTGIYLGQAAIAIVAVLAVSSEYSTGMIRVTLAAMPRRATVLAAKAAILTGPVLAAGALAVLGSVLAGRLILPGRGIGPAHGYPALSLADGPVLRAAVGSVLYLALIALLSLGVAAAVRDGAAAIGIVLGLLYLFPILGQVVGSATWHRHLEELAPMTAGLAIQATTGLHSLPISPWAGIGVLAGWAAAALLAGGILLRLRDA